MTTDSKHSLSIAPNVLEQNFTANEPNRIWVADITCVWTAQGWCYLATIVDLFARSVVGWAFADHFFASLKKECLRRSHFATRTEAFDAITAYIDGFYNPIRRHSALNYQGQIAFESASSYQHVA